MIGYMRDSMGLDQNTVVKVITVCHDIGDYLDEGVSINVIIILFQGFQLSSSWTAAYETGSLGRGFKGSHLGKGIPCRSYTEGKSRRATIQGVKVTSGVPRGSVLGQLLFLVYVNDIWRNTDLSIRLFTDDCTIYRKITNNISIEKLQKDLDTMRE